MANPLADIRAEIDKLDEQLVELLCRRCGRADRTAQERKK